MKNPFADTNLQLIGGGVIIAVAVILGLTNFKLPAKEVSFTTDQSTMTTPAPQATYTFSGQLPDDQLLNRQVRLVTSKGEIVIALDSTQAPIASSNFLSLVEQGLYNGIVWHRVVPGFVIQAGDPQTKDPSVDPSRWGSGGPGYTFDDEPVTAEYTTGTVAMANAGPNTNGSQFFIILEDQSTLPKAYTIFGKVTAGLDTVQAITAGDQITSAVVEPAG